MSTSTGPVGPLSPGVAPDPAIDHDAIPSSLVAHAVAPDDDQYGPLRSTYMRGGRPGLILRPTSVDEVVDAVGFARAHRHLPLGLRSGGHGVSGRSTNHGGLVIDVSALDSIEVVDEARRRVRIGPGARWGRVATELSHHGWALTSGDFGGVGVGGLATAGGIGLMSRRYGLTIDHLTAVEMVLADGSTVRATDTENSELFWAVRGAGANFGVATSFEFEVDEVADVGWAQLAFRVDDLTDFLQRYGRVTSGAPREMTSNLIMGGSRVAQVMAMVASADPKVVVSQLQPLAEIAPLVQQQVVMTPYAAIMNMFPDMAHRAVGEPFSRSGLAVDLTPGLASACARLIESGVVHWFQIRGLGGATSDVSLDATAFAHRDAQFSITAMGSDAARVDARWASLRPHLSGIYLSFETGTDPDLAATFPGSTLDRLRALKGQLDPRSLFRDNFVITPGPVSSPHTS